MPVIDKSSPGHTNGESAGGTIKELEPTKLTQEMVFPQEPSNQVSDENDCNKLRYFSYLDIYIYISDLLLYTVCVLSQAKLLEYYMMCNIYPCFTLSRCVICWTCWVVLGSLSSPAHPCPVQHLAQLTAQLGETYWTCWEAWM
jgi:hypothetical protein